MSAGSGGERRGWGSWAARRPRRRGRVELAAAALDREAQREPSPAGSRNGPAALTDTQTNAAPRLSAHLFSGGRRTVEAAASRGQQPEPAPGGGVEGVGARGVALKLFVQLLGCSRSGGAVVRAGGAEPSGSRSVSSGLEEPQSEEGEEEEEKEEERGPGWLLGAQKPGSWTGEAAVCADSALAARAPQALARASAPGGRGARQGAEESGQSRSPSRRGSASRAGPGRASETMNFLLSWVHWSLALLLYLHHAKWSQAAPMTEEGEHRSHEVVKFMDVYQRSYCRPIETLVDIFQEYPDEIEYIFKPSCVPLMRCGGCCNDEGLECVPTEEFNITMQIMRIKPHQSQHIGEMSFLQHNKCECRKSIRGKGKGQKRKRKKSRYKSWSVYVVPAAVWFPGASLAPDSRLQDL
ncbi:Vascular endothelial growth factor A [Galemys pyrenaicus]|uniref:Vascular endothelial growth factor A n=1 Tax=Galemys pyrenaicus TaxID=202257 RepID=A0A8J6A1F4_GALPY|nr:Vascular endothelial growth factor A [Galemys pyrenaicus]